jgi:hypothetical protein
MIIEWPSLAGGLAAPAGVPVKKPSIARRRAAGLPDNPGERVSGASNSVSPPFPELAEKNRSRIGLNLQELNRPQRRITNVANC